MATTANPITPQRMILMEILGTARPMCSHTPLTRLQALMEAAPGDTPQVSIEELDELRDVLIDAIEEMEPIDQYLVGAAVIERKSIRSLATVLGTPKSTLHRKLGNLLGRLAERLHNEPAVQAYLQRQHALPVEDVDE